MHLIVQTLPGDPAPLYAARKPLAMYCHGKQTDRAFQDGRMATVRGWCKQARELGCMVGVGTHQPEVIALVEEQRWDVHFFAGCVYNRTRTPDEWRKALNGESLEMPGEIYLQSDPPRMYQVMRQTRKTCFAFKIMAAGRIGDSGVDGAFRQAFASIKPNDGIFLGVFPRVKDEVRENAERACRLVRSIWALSGARVRATRPASSPTPIPGGECSPLPGVRSGRLRHGEWFMMPVLRPGSWPSAAAGDRRSARRGRTTRSPVQGTDAGCLATGP